VILSVLGFRAHRSVRNYETTNKISGCEQEVCILMNSNTAVVRQFKIYVLHYSPREGLVIVLKCRFSPRAHNISLVLL
jgi:hypothetical protein